MKILMLVLSVVFSSELTKEDFAVLGRSKAVVNKTVVPQQRALLYEEGYAEAVRRNLPLRVYKNVWPSFGPDFVTSYVTWDDDRFTKEVTEFQPQNGVLYDMTKTASPVKTEKKTVRMCGPNGCFEVPVEESVPVYEPEND